MINTTTIQNDIMAGTYDQELPQLQMVIHTRLAQLRNVSATGFQVGKRVRFNSKVNPRYLCGERATIVKVNRKRVKIKLDVPAGRFQGIINCPTNLLEVI